MWIFVFDIIQIHLFGDQAVPLSFIAQINAVRRLEGAVFEVVGKLAIRSASLLLIDPPVADHAFALAVDASSEPREQAVLELAL